MKQCIIAAYMGLALSFVISLLTKPLPEKTAEYPALTTESPPTETAAVPESNVTTVPERIKVKQGDEILELELEEYLIGVLAAEMPADFEPEALKAQAVAARSYTLYCVLGDKHDKAHICTDYNCCQAWKSPGQMKNDWGEGYEENLQKIRRAVEETGGEYLTYMGEPIFSAFHSSSAGKTESCGAIWSELPYLVSVDSPESEADVPGYTSRVELSVLDFRDSLLHLRPEADFSGDEKSWIGEIVLGDSGRVESVSLGGEIFSGRELRELFALRSTAFTLKFTGESFLFSVTGFGHGVGMSQYGAQVMARGGADYTAILAHYYPGTRLMA